MGGPRRGADSALHAGDSGYDPRPLVVVSHDVTSRELHRDLPRPFVVERSLSLSLEPDNERHRLRWIHHFHEVGLVAFRLDAEDFSLSGRAEHNHLERLAPHVRELPQLI